MLVSPDFSEIADQIKPGEYNLRITGAEAKEYSTGTKYINWTLETFGEEDSKNDGRKIWYSTPTHGKGAFLIQKLWNTATSNSDWPAEFDTEMLLSKEIKAVVDINAGGYTEVKAIKPMQ